MFLNCYISQNVRIFLIFLVLKFNCYEFNTNVNQRFYTNSTTSNLFRFRDFEPRYVLKTDTELSTTTMFDGLIRSTRKSRGFQFHADNNDVNIDLEFIVPFVKIPIARGMSVTQTAFRNLFNLNFQSLLTTGAIVAIGGIFAILLKGFFSPFVHISDYKKNSRLDNADAVSPILQPFLNAENVENATKILNVNQFATILESKLQENNVNISHCIQKTVCSYVQNFNKDAGGFQKIMDGVISLDSVRNYLSGTAIQHAVDSAKDGQNCDVFYPDCNWYMPTKKILKLLAKNLNYLNNT